jgi:8-oxo-dGTP diphosphatase
MIEVKFYETVNDSLLKFAVIVAKHKGKWVFCKHKERDTYECPGGHREEGETILETAKRELWEETGAIQFNLEKICVYSVIRDCEETFGMLYFANIEEFGKLPMMEIEKIELFDGLPGKWTYPLIQPKLIEKIQDVIFRGAPL